MRFTVVGAGGFIGAAVSARLKSDGAQVFSPRRDNPALFSQRLGHVIYAAGVTADFRERPFDTLRANTGLLADLLENAEFESLLYLSSARIYRHAEHTREDAAISLKPSDPEDLYDFTKLTAEALCQASGRKQVRVVRLSNVVGPDFRSKNFLFDLIRDACEQGQIRLRTALQSEKDYIRLDDVVELLPRVAVAGGHGCYNMGSGRNLSHADVVAAIVANTGAKVSMTENAPLITSRPLDTTRLRDEFGFLPRSVVEYLPALVDQYRTTP
jgi:nucleoside-diphosphate-sugar epimerase